MTIQWEVRTTGNDNNGGAFDDTAAGTDYSQQNAAQASGTNLTVHASDNTKVQPDGHTPVAADVGNTIQITAGAGFTTGFYRITAQDGTYWTLHASPAATSTSGGTWAMGGALASPGLAFKSGFPQSDIGFTVFNHIHIKAGTYTLTTTTAGVNGPLHMIDNVNYIVEGYNATRGDAPAAGSRPYIDAGVLTSFNIVQFDDEGGVQPIKYLDVDGNGNTSVRGFHGPYGGNEYTAFRCRAIACTNYGFAAMDSAIECEADGCNIGFQVLRAYGCRSHDCTSNGFQIGAGSQGCWHCIADSNGGYGFDHGGASGQTYVGCIAYNNTSHGFNLKNITWCYGCISTNNGGWGFTGHNTAAHIHHCATYNNTSGGVNTTPYFYDPVAIALSADPFVDAPNGDFNLNTTAGGGQTLRDHTLAVP